MPSYTVSTAVVLLTLSFLCACARPPAENANSPNSQNLPFDRQRSTGVSPSQSLIPSTTKLPEGTPIPIRLQSAVSSASSHAGDTFQAIIDEPVVVDGQTLVPPGTPATGRVLEAKPSQRSLEPGYLRIVLVSLNVDGKPVMIETSSIFAKGGSRESRAPATGVGQKDVVFSVDRRLSFRLAQSVDLQ
ncbi:MAG: hypothetical protein LAO30_15750 [Acidobacteriia bacterium]|nr:hypothetical protein [Terriglobia bacterium]